MPQNSESAAYLGGIGMMVSQSDVCPTCGKIHQARHFGLRVVRDGGCPVVVLGAFPMMSEADEPIESFSDAHGRTDLDRAISERPESLLAVQIPRRRSAPLPIPWPNPPQTEDYL
jgi:hypothetical protein